MRTTETDAEATLHNQKESKKQRRYRAKQAEQDAIDLQALQTWIAASGAQSPAQIKAALHALVPEYAPQLGGY